MRCLFLDSSGGLCKITKQINDEYQREKIIFLNDLYYFSLYILNSELCLFVERYFKTE